MSTGTRRSAGSVGLIEAIASTHTSARRTCLPLSYAHQPGQSPAQHRRTRSPPPLPRSRGQGQALLLLEDARSGSAQRLSFKAAAAAAGSLPRGRRCGSARRPAGVPGTAGLRGASSLRPPALPAPRCSCTCSSPAGRGALPRHRRQLCRRHIPTSVGPSLPTHSPSLHPLPPHPKARPYLRSPGVILKGEVKQTNKPSKQPPRPVPPRAPGRRCPARAPRWGGKSRRRHRAHGRRGPSALPRRLPGTGEGGLPCGRAPGSELTRSVINIPVPAVPAAPRRGACLLPAERG